MEYIKSFFWVSNGKANEAKASQNVEQMASIQLGQQQIIGNSSSPVIISPSSCVSIIHENRSNKCEFISSPSESFQTAMSKELGGHSNMGFSVSTQDVSLKSIKSPPAFNQNQQHQNQNQ